MFVTVIYTFESDVIEYNYIFIKSDIATV